MAYDRARDPQLEPDVPNDIDGCLDGPEGCEGPTEFRMALSATGMSYQRCEKHWAERLDAQEERDYPDSPIPPAWFDPSAAGEVWDEAF